MIILIIIILLFKAKIHIFLVNLVTLKIKLHLFQQVLSVIPQTAQKQPTFEKKTVIIFHLFFFKLTFVLIAQQQAGLMSLMFMNKTPLPVP